MFQQHKSNTLALAQAIAKPKAHKETLSRQPKMSTTNLQPLLLHGSGGPNPAKVLILLSVLNLPHRAITVPLSEVKSQPYTDLNPNGRLPTLVDPNNNDLTLWETGAIVTYLVTRYDKEGKFSFEQGSEEAWHALQWLCFQVSGQGPYLYVFLSSDCGYVVVLLTMFL
jgi:hypothetical protein